VDGVVNHAVCVFWENDSKAYLIGIISIMDC